MMSYDRDHQNEVMLRAVAASRRWRERSDEVPPFSLNSGYQIQLCPPFGAADARMFILTPSGRKWSVYLDMYDSLGSVGTPYWEFYEIRDGNSEEPKRYNLSNLAEGIDHIYQEEVRGINGN